MAGAIDDSTIYIYIYISSLLLILLLLLLTQRIIRSTVLKIPASHVLWMSSNCYCCTQLKVNFRYQQRYWKIVQPKRRPNNTVANWSDWYADCHISGKNFLASAKFIGNLFNSPTEITATRTFSAQYMQRCCSVVRWLPRIGQQA